MRKEYKAFTLVEMLIVMGIIIILMAVGIASGRFAIRRANKIEHENAAEQLYQAMQSYYSDSREYPMYDATYTTFQEIVEGPLSLYIDDFDGGSEATFYYDVDTTGQVAVICVSLGGSLDENNLGYYCTGNGINEAGVLDIDITEKDIEYDAGGTSLYTTVDTQVEASTADKASEWDPATPWL